MKLKKKIIVSSILAFSVFVSSTSYASEKDAPMIRVNEKALSEMADKVTDDTIFTEEGENGKANGESKPSEKKSDENTINPPSVEGSGEEVKPINPQEQKDPGKTEDKTTDNTGKAESEGANNPSKIEENKNEKPSTPINNDLASGRGPSQDAPIATENQNSVGKNLDDSNLELMNRLNNIKSDQESQGERFYISSKNPETGSLEKLTSKETLITSYNDKGNNLRLNLANTAEYDEASKSKYVISPQTLILLIAVLAAIFSAISIAIKGKKPTKKDS